jgi:hypothetical protein
MSLISLHIPGEVSAWFGVLGYLLLVFTPGAWIMFGLSMDEIPFWARLLISAMLSPLIVCAEFYTLRLIGIPFGPVAIILVFLNLPALYLIWRRRANIGALNRSGWLIGALAVVISIICMIPVLVHMDARIHSPHGWLHADAVYMFARGALVLEDPTLAGVRLSFPVWTALVFQAVHSFLVNSPPVSCYVWNNLLALIAVFGFAVGITREMGGGSLAQVSSGIWLLIGANPVGYILMQIAPWGMSHELWGDMRYTPWVSKFLDFGPMPLALGMLSAMIYLLICPRALTRRFLVVICLLLSGIGLLYPLLLPPACALIGAKGVALATNRPNWRRNIPYRDWLALAGLAFVAVVATYAELKFLTSDRHVAAANSVMLSGLLGAARKGFESLIATSLFVAGLAFIFRNSRKHKRSGTALLLCGALASYILYVVFNIPYYENEYKFIFAVVMCLAVFPAIAVERIWREWFRARSVPVLVAIAALVLGTYGYWTYVYWPAPWAPRAQGILKEPSYGPPINAGDFYIQLGQTEEWSGICNAVRRLTPADSILIVNNGRYYYPTLTARSLYVSAENRVYPGVNHHTDDLDAGLRGYGRPILERRRAILSALFDAKDPIRREQALSVLLALKRPIAIIAEPQHSDLLDWLRHMETASQLYVENGLTLWLVDSHRLMPGQQNRAALGDLQDIDMKRSLH